MAGYAQGRHAVGMCGRCGIKAALASLVQDGQVPNLLVHTWCRDIRHEQETVVPKDDPQILRRPSPDTDDVGESDHEGDTLVEARADTGPYFGGDT